MKHLIYLGITKDAFNFRGNPNWTDFYHKQPCMVKATAVLGEVCWSGDNRGRVVLLGRVVVRRVKDVVEDVLLHLPNLGVPVDPSLVSYVRHSVKVVSGSDCVLQDNDLCPCTNLPDGTHPTS